MPACCNRIAARMPDMPAPMTTAFIALAAAFSFGEDQSGALVSAPVSCSSSVRNGA